VIGMLLDAAWTKVQMAATPEAQDAKEATAKTWEKM
jgi:hypothetical protein